MDFELTSTNPVVKAIVAGTAPRPAQLAASRGILPLPQNDLLEVLVAFIGKNDAELAANARNTLASQDTKQLGILLKSNEVAPPILDYFAGQDNLPTEIHETILTGSRENCGDAGSSRRRFAANRHQSKLGAKLSDCP
jgi:hypothetical protein